MNDNDIKSYIDSRCTGWLKVELQMKKNQDSNKSTFFERLQYLLGKNAVLCKSETPATINPPHPQVATASSPRLLHDNVLLVILTLALMESEYLSGLFRRCCLALVGSHTGDDCKYEKAALEQIVIMAENYITSLLSQLQRITSIQRRQSPSTEDLAILFYLNDINILDLINEAQDLPRLEATVPVNALNALQFDPDIQEIPANEKVFFESSNSLAPTIRHKPSGFESWMPNLPPDHTYLQTPSYSSEIRNLWQVRQKLVHE
ncbi:hypothetical protein FF38_11315, partial [Lucilia cuprina]